MKIATRKGFWVGAGLLALLPLLAACQLEMEITLNDDGSGVAVTRFITDDEVLFHEALRSAQEFAQEAQERGQRVTVKMSRRGPEYVVNVEQRFRTVEELNDEGDPYGLEPIFALVHREGGQQRLLIQNFTPVLPTKLTIRTPGPITSASPGVVFEGRRATWAGVAYAGDLYVDYRRAGTGLDPGESLLLVILTVLGGLGFAALQRRRRRPIEIEGRGAEAR